MRDTFRVPCPAPAPQVSTTVLRRCMRTLPALRDKLVSSSMTQHMLLPFFSLINAACLRCAWPSLSGS